MLLFCLLGALPALAEPPEAELVSFSREERQEALQQIPFSQIDPAQQQRVAGVVRSPSIFRRLPVQVVDCDQELYRFLVHHPEVVVNIWELMGITNVQVKRLSPTRFHASDGAGTVSTVDLIYADEEKNLFFAQGQYDGPLAPRPITAECVLLLQSGFTETEEGRTFVSNRLDVFVKFDSKGADLLARTLHPLIGKTADYNFAETSAFIGKISTNSRDNFLGMQNLVSKLSSIDPEVRQQFATVVGRVYQRGVAMEHELQRKLAQQDPHPAAVSELPRPASRENQTMEPARLKGPVQLAAQPLPIASAREMVDADDDEPAAVFSSIPRKRHAELRRY